MKENDYSDEENEQREGSQESADDLNQDPLAESEQQGLVEALLLAAGEPLEFRRIADVSGIDDEALKDIIESIKMKFALEESGFELAEISGKYQFRTKSLYAPYIQKLRAGRPRRLTPAALETLAIIAYRQPIVKSDVEKIRGVDATPTIKTLLERGIVRIVGHKATAGQPALYGTTEKFLSIFGLSSLSELPTLRDLKELEMEPGEHAQDEQEDRPESENSHSSGEQLSA